MQIGMVGLGKMGANMVKRLVRGGHEVVAFDLSEHARRSVESEGAQSAASLEELVSKLSTPRTAWVMVPSGDPTTSTVNALAKLLSPGDVVVDGGNSFYKDAFSQSAELQQHGIKLIDAGVSGGIWGLEAGYCLMVGGDDDAVAQVEPAFLTLAPRNGYAHVGSLGAGHFVKMVHNGIEYGMMQAYAEGFELMSKADEFSLDMHQIAGIWRYGSVVRSWLLDLIERALAPEAGFENVKGYVADSGEGRWTVQEAVDRAVAIPVIASALFARFSSRNPDAYSAKLTAAQRNQFGGHAMVVENDLSAESQGTGAVPDQGDKV